MSVVDFARRLGAAWDSLDDVFALALVPLVSSLLSISNVVRVATFDGIHVGLTLRFPTAVADLWTFVSLPNPEGGLVPGSLLALPIVVVVRGLLAAGYLGSLHDGRTDGSYDFAAAATDHAAPMLGYVLLLTLVALLTGGAVLAGGGAAFVLLLVVGLPLFVLLSYLFYGTPYLIVIRDAGLFEALGGSYEYALAGGAYFAFGIRYLGVVAVSSIVATAVVVNLGVFGVLLGALVTAPVGLALNLATLDFLVDLDGGPSTTDGGARY